MAAMVVSNVPGQTKVTVAGTAVTSSDTLTASQVGSNGVLLNVINGGGSPINVTILDPGKTGAGNVGTTSAQAVANATDGWFRILPGHVDLVSGLATVTYSGTTTVTYKAIPA
jgi:hypothetical protein